MFSRVDLAELYRIAQDRVENVSAQKELQQSRSRSGLPTRRDVLWGYTRFAGLEVCPRFADTGDLFLYLEPL